MKLAIVGLKGHQSVVLQGARELGDVELVAISDDDPQELARFKKREPLAKDAQTYADGRHLIEHTLADVYCVCDENGLRAEQLEALAARNVHVVTEKPLATTLEGLSRIKRAFAKSQGQLTMLLTMRHDPKYATLRKLVQDGAVGQVCQLAAQKSYRLGNRPQWQTSRERLGGTIPYIGIHVLDLMRWTTGLEFTHVAAFHGRIGKPQMKETENHASLALRMSNGASASCHLDYLRPDTAPTHGDDRFRIAGDRGVIEAFGTAKELQLLTVDGEPQAIKPEPTENLFVEFVKRVREGKPHRIPADDCYRITEVVLRARQAADEMKLVELGATK